MDDDRDRLEELERQLRDERRLRDAAERKASRQAENALTWRRRAEERTARIEDLLEQRERRGTFVGRLRANAAAVRRAVRDSSPGSADEGRTGEDVGPSAAAGQASAALRRRLPALPHVQLAHLVSDLDLSRIVAETTPHDLLDDDGGLFEADVVVVDEEALAAAPPDARVRFEEWERLDARQPLLWLGADRPFHGATVAIGRDVPRPVTFDPAVSTPIGRPGAVDVGALDAPPDRGSRAWVEASAAARPFADDADPVRAADRRRRAAWAANTPAAAAAGLLAATGWRFEDPTPGVTAVLVSNRPDDLRRQLVAITDQLHRPLRVAVGCHGFSSHAVAEELTEAGERVPVTVIDLPGDRSLGWCLNRVVEETTEPVFAKIDDDDHYGPGYLVDALQAMDYADAAIVGRVCSFTHLEGRGTTVLRRLGDEERDYDGTLVGATMVVRRSAWERSPFPHKTLAEDVGLQRGIMRTGGRMYVASRWDFVYRRRAGSDNTWRAPDEHFLSNAEHAWDGWEPHRADLAHDPT